RLSWPAAQLGEALSWLARRRGLSTRITETASGPPVGDDPEVLTNWIDAAAAGLGIEAEPVDWSYPEATSLVRNCAPALLQLQTTAAPRFLAILSGGRRTVTLLSPTLVQYKFQSEAMRAALCHEVERLPMVETKALLERAAVPGNR